MLVLEIVPRLPQEQANTISERKQNEISIICVMFMVYSYVLDPSSSNLFMV